MNRLAQFLHRLLDRLEVYTLSPSTRDGLRSRFTGSVDAPGDEFPDDPLADYVDYTPLSELFNCRCAPMPIEPPPVVTAFAPNYFPLGHYWSFVVMGADRDTEAFIETLPCVQRVTFDDFTGAHHVVLRTVDAYDQDSANQCYLAVLLSLQAREEVPQADENVSAFMAFVDTLNF